MITIERAKNGYIVRCDEQVYISQSPQETLQQVVSIMATGTGKEMTVTLSERPQAPATEYEFAYGYVESFTVS